MPKRRANNEGSIRQKRPHLWEARFCAGRDPGTGKLIRKSVYGSTQQEVRKKLADATRAVDAGTYQEPSELTVSQWLDLWANDYCLNVKPRTLELYKATIENRIKPNLGAVKLKKLTAPMIQKFYNNALKGQLKPPPVKPGKVGNRNASKKALSPKTIKNMHGILHKALAVAVRIGMIAANPADCAELPRIERAEIQPLPESTVPAFLDAIKGDRYELLMQIDMFTGLRLGEILGLPWSAVDFKAGTITVKQQLQKQKTGWIIAPTKNGKSRVVAPAPFVFDSLREQQTIQNKWKAVAGRYWSNEDNLVFTNELGGHLTHCNVYRHLKKAAAAVGLPDFRFHDLRHTFAVYSLESGADVKSVQSALGHYSAAFTLDTYVHSTEQMQQRNAQRMQQFAESLINKKTPNPKKD